MQQLQAARQSKNPSASAKTLGGEEQPKEKVGSRRVRSLELPPTPFMDADAGGGGGIDWGDAFAEEKLA